MAQGIIGGATDYTEQSLNSINDDIERWIQLTKKVQEQFEDSIAKSNENGFWNKVDYNFKLTLVGSKLYFPTIIEDLLMVKQSIKDDNVTERGVKLLHTIGNCSRKYNAEYGENYHKNDLWKEYGTPDFQIIEKMYQDGRDYFVTLQDAGNAAERLRDYIQGNNMMNVNFNGAVNESQIQVGTLNSNQTFTKESQDFPYDELTEMLLKINENNKEYMLNLGDKGEDFCRILTETLDKTQKREKPSIIRKLLSSLHELGVGFAGSMAATAAWEALPNFMLIK